MGGWTSCLCTLSRPAEAYAPSPSDVVILHAGAASSVFIDDDGLPIAIRVVRDKTSPPHGFDSAIKCRRWWNLSPWALIWITACWYCTCAQISITLDNVSPWDCRIWMRSRSQDKIEITLPSYLSGWFGKYADGTAFTLVLTEGECWCLHWLVRPACDIGNKTFPSETAWQRP